MAIDNYGDTRQTQWCVHCGTSLGDNKIDREHVPTKALIKRPFPVDYPTFSVCAECNEELSKDEEYFVVFLSCVLSGSTDHSVQPIPAAQRILQRNIGLLNRLSAACISQDGSAIWNPERARIENVLVKNARCHVLFEANEPHWEEPQEVFFSPIEMMSERERNQFFQSNPVQGWPEVGCRWMQRVCDPESSFDKFGFYEFQKGTYRFRIETDDGVGVSSVIWNYLAAKIMWR